MVVIRAQGELTQFGLHVCAITGSMLAIFDVWFAVCEGDKRLQFFLGK